MNKDDKKRTHIIVTGKGGGGSGTTDWNDITNKPDFANVATSGSYTDLNDKPTILTQWFGTQAEYDAIVEKDPNVIYNIEGSDNVQADWNQTDTTADDYIKNKPTIPAMAIQELTFTLEGGVKKTIEFYTAPNYFYVQDISGADNTLSITKSSSSVPDIEVFCSTDRSNWTSMGTTSTTAITATVPANGKLYLKATTNNWATDFEKRNNIKVSGNHNVGGNIMSLLYGDNFEGQTTFPSGSTYTFNYLFDRNSALVNAQDLILPATTLVDSCYRGMFNACTSLTTAPALPATTLNAYCYNATFAGCSALTAAPALPATTMAWGCYSDMFNGCTNLNKVVTYAQNILSGWLTNWLANVAAQGNFFNLGNPAPTYPSGASGIPTGWTEHTSL